jgi:hypothetical protein
MELENANMKIAHSILIGELTEGTQSFTVQDENEDTLETFEYSELSQAMTEQEFLANTGIVLGLSAWITE